MNKTKILLLIILLLIKYNINAQNNIIILKVHPTIGDTVDEAENNKYKLFDNYPTGQFKYAIYKLEKNNINVILTLKNGETILIPYDVEKMLADTEKISSSNKIGSSEVEIENNDITWHINHSIIGGVWIPTGELSKLGIHPNAGYQGEGAYSRFSIGLEFSAKFLPTKETYFARRVHSNNQIIATNDFLGIYFGINGGFDLYDSKLQKIRIIGGIALDGFDALAAKGNLKSESIWTSNVNIGIGYRRQLIRKKYIGIQVKYNYVDYSKSKIIDMSGQPITVLLEYGGFDFKKKKLQ